MKTKIFTLAMVLTSTYVFAQWQTFGNAVLPGQFLGSTNNQPLNIRTNNIPRAQFTTGNALNSWLGNAGDGLRIFDPAGGGGNLDLFAENRHHQKLIFKANNINQIEVRSQHCNH